MTREEAINILNDYDINFEGHTAEEIGEAFDTAFKALKQELCEPILSHSELTGLIYVYFGGEKYEITRQAIEAVRAIQEKVANCHPQEPITERVEHGTDGNSYKLTISNGKEFEQKPKPGYWIKYDNEYFAEGRLTPVTCSIRECSACHVKIVDFCGKMYYCPYCGEQKESEGI